MKERNYMISRLDHNGLDNFLDETRDQDTTFKTKTKAVTLKTKTNTVKILSRDWLTKIQLSQTSFEKVVSK